MTTPSSNIVNINSALEIAISQNKIFISTIAAF